VHNKLDPLRVLYRRAVNREIVATDPTVGLELPLVRGRRERVISRERARLLLDVLPDGERALWATALYGGLRIGELRALRWRDVDFAGRMIHVRRSWDDVEGEIEVKSDAAWRRVPLAGRLCAELEAHRVRTERAEDELVFGRTPHTAFVRTTVRRRAIRAVDVHNEKIRVAAEAEGRELRAGELVELLTPHEARHTAASYLIAAGLNAKQLQTYIGHSDIRTTYNVYGHLFDGDEMEAAEQLDKYLAAA
jgi:integrase